MRTETVEIETSDGHIVHGTVTTPSNVRASALLVHGITADRHEWGFFDALVHELSMIGVCSLAIDYRGHGSSDLPIAELSLSGVMIDVIASWEYLRGIQPDVPSIIVGNSFGGGISFLVGQSAEGCSHVYMTCPVTSYVSDVSRVNSQWMDQAQSGFIKYASKRLSAFIVPEFFAFDHLINAQTIATPFSVVHGAEDSDVPPEESEAFLLRRASASRYHSLPGMDHSFSAPENASDRETLSPKLRKEAAKYIASIIEI